jgi:signal transduction histidine kinase
MKSIMDRTPLRSTVSRYGLALLVVALALLLRWAFWPVLGPELPFLFFWPAVMIAARYGGLGPGLLVTALSVLAEDFFLIQPGSVGTGSSRELIGMALFGLLGALLSVLADRLRRARQLADSHAEELAQAHRRKDEFLAMLGHELRNPLAPLKNAAHILRLREAADEQARWAAEVIDRQVGQMSRLVDDLLDVSRITRGQVRLQKEVVELAAVIERAVEISRPLIEARRHELVESPPKGPAWLEADPVRLAQVIANLLNNAAKYTEERGRITLRAEREGAEVVLRVRDNGLGLAPDVLPHVFELFTQDRRTLDRSQGGLGIGLTLVKGLVEMHGGSVQALSEGPGKGSEFVVRLPAKVASGPDQGEDDDPVPSAPAVGSRVLIVDDNADSAESLAMLLAVRGHEVRTAPDGPAALDAAEEFRPEAVILDIGLPGMDGYEVARRLRGRGLANAFLVAVTGYGADEDRLRAEEAGFDAHLVKPADPDTLERLLARPEWTPRG